MQTDQLIHLLNLLNIKGIGPSRIRSLISQYHQPHTVFQLSQEKLCQVNGIDVGLAQKICAYSDYSYGKKILKSVRSINGFITTYWDQAYPVLLKKIYDPPVILFCMGQELEQQEDSIAVVGTRKLTAYGRTVTISLVKELVKSDLTIVSGLARGIDTIAHQTAVQQGGRTIAVLGSGIDVIYPPENRKLADRIREAGTIISEFPPGTKPDAGNFPQRNRIISGLSHATVVVEAGNRSGAILTALNAIDQNRDVFAVPGRITDKQSVGTLRLISHGAVPAIDGTGILNNLESRLFKPRVARQQKLNLDLTDDEHKVYKYLSHDPIHIDDLATRTGLEITVLLTILLQLELKQAVVQLSGKNFVIA